MGSDEFQINGLLRIIVTGNIFFKLMVANQI